MKVLHINTIDIQGGAARAAYRLHQGMLQARIDSQMLVQTKDSDDPTVIGPATTISKFFGYIRPTLDRFPLKFYPQKKQTPFHPAWLPFSSVIKKIDQIDPDIVHLHYIAGGFLRIEDICKIKLPIIWSLHDMWGFTGGCHIDGDCGKYMEQCGLCPVLNSDRKRDLSYKTFVRKQRVYSKKDHLTINGLSRWLADCASSSALFGKKKIVNIPNPINTDTFSPLPKHQAKTLLNLSSDKKHALFGAMNAAIDLNKGFGELTRALRSLELNGIELIVFGSNQPPNAPHFPFPAHYFGRMHDDISLRILYSAGDVMIVPSLQEAFGQTASEAMACGTPVVSFATTGLLDIVDHKKNGYLAKAYDTMDLAEGIKWVLNEPEFHKILCSNARQKIVNNFDVKVVIPKYVELYRSILSQGQ